MSRTGKHRSRTAAQPGVAAEEADDLRALCRALDFWRVCGKPACRRALDCGGDAEACFRTFWWQMPEEASLGARRDPGERRRNGEQGCGHGRRCRGRALARAADALRAETRT